MSRFFRSLLLVLLLSLAFPLASVSSENDQLTERVWQSLLKAEIKLNQGMPKQLAPDLWIRAIKVDRKSRLVRYEGLVTGEDAKHFSQEKIQLHRMRYRQQSLNHLCGHKQSKQFLNLLSKAGGKVEYVFYAFSKESPSKFLLSFLISYQDCQKTIPS